MKNRISKILIGLIAIFMTASCEKEWLDVSNSAQIEAEEQFESPQGFKDALMGVYMGMASPELYAKDMTWNLVDLLSQQYATLPDLAIYSDVQQFKYRSVTSTDQIDALWINSYNVIANINIILEYLESNGDILDPVDYAIIKGELLGLRAFLHFDMMRLYGYGNLADRNVSGELAIPYVTEFTKEVTPQKTYAETFELLENDISQALELLKMDPIYNGTESTGEFYETGAQEFYDMRRLRMNYYAVKGLEARVHLWQGTPEDLEKAQAAAEEVIFESPFELINSATYPVSADPIFLPEMIFGLNVTGFTDIVNPYHEYNQATDYNVLYLTQSSAAEIFETDSINIGVADVRFNTLLEAKSDGGLISVKLVQGDLLYYDTMPLITLPEMYYIAAEAYLESNNLAKAIEYLNTVRSSRGIIAEIPETADKGTVAEELFKEYRKEFVSEGQLFYFYKRLGLETIPGLSETITLDDDIYVLPYPDNEIQFGNR